MFCALRAEFPPVRATLAASEDLRIGGLNGCTGRIGNPAHRGDDRDWGAAGARSRAPDAGRAQGCQSVIIAGVAGALAPILQLGRLVLAERVIMRGHEDMLPEQVLEVRQDWFDTFSAASNSAGIDFARGGILTSSRALSTPAEKLLAFDQSGAIAVDMESAAIALEADARGLPFVACGRFWTARTGGRGRGAEDEDGKVRPMAVLRALLTRPAMLAAGYRLLRNLRLSTDLLAQTLEAALRNITPAAAESGALAVESFCTRPARLRKSFR